MYSRCTALLLSLLALALAACQQFPGPPTPAVVLDIGHTAEHPGARTPGKVDGRRLSEFEFWYENCHYTKKVIEEAGYPCVVCTRGYSPDEEKYEEWAERADVHHLRKSEKPGRRVPASQQQWQRLAPLQAGFHHPGQPTQWHPAWPGHCRFP